MKICQFHTDNETIHVGLVVDDHVVAIEAAAAEAGLSHLASATSIALLSITSNERVAIQSAAARLNGAPISDLRLAPPISTPEKIICLGLNYRDHAAETGLPLPKAPILFPKFREALIGHRETIRPPIGDHDIDYEAELALVIGRGGRNIQHEDALDQVGGYMPFNDVSARDLQNITTQWTAGKAIDTFGPSGPYLTTADEVIDPQALRIRARVNGETLQDGTTADMIFDIAEQIEFISSLMTLKPGDIIATGTPAGVGFTRNPQILLHDGDIVEVEIEGLGILSNPVGAPNRTTRVGAAAATTA